MKSVIITLALCLPFICISQVRDPKLPKDSLLFYHKELKSLYTASQDSLKSSDRYKEVYKKLYPNGENVSPNFGVEMIVFTGLQVNNYSGLNARLSSLRIKEKKTLMLPVGVGLSFRFNKIIVGYDMTAVTVGDNSTGSYIHTYLSTNIIKSKNWIFSPQVGYGQQTVTVRVPTQSNATNFDSYFTSQSNLVELTSGNPVLDFAVAIKLRKRNSTLNVPFFRFGYRYGLSEKPWEVTNGNSSGAPIDRNSNFYFHLMLGMGE